MGEQGSDMEKMIEMFLGMDKNDDGFVDLGELRTACQEKKLDMKQVNGWLSRYDTNKDGKISLDEFCDGLGLGKQEMIVEKEERDISNTKICPTIAHEIKPLDTTMSVAKQAHITDKFIELAKEVSSDPHKMNQVAAKMKRFLDEQYGRVWQVIVLAGSYWINYSHAPFLSMQFQYGPYICIVWRTTIN